MNPPTNPPAPNVRVFHFADVHLGVETYGRYNPATGLNTRLEDFTHSLNHAIDKALESDIDLALFAGDAYKARDPNQTHQKAFAHALARLTRANIPVVMLVGNHDIPNTRGRAHALEIYELLGQIGVQILSKPETVVVNTLRGAVLVAGMPYLTRSTVLAQEQSEAKTVEEVSKLIRGKYVTYITQMAHEMAAHPEYIALLMGHFTIQDVKIGTQDFLLNENEPQVALSDIAQPTFDYVAMGHVHRHQNMNRGHQPPVIYSGSIDRIDFGERAEEKGFVLADVRKGRADWKHIVLPTRPFVQIDVDTKDSDDPTQVLVNAIGKYPITDAVVRVTYKVPQDKVPLLRMDEVKQALGRAHLLVALQREMPTNSTLIRSQSLTEAITPEKALGLYIESQSRLAPRREELLMAARPLFDELTQETLR